MSALSPMVFPAMEDPPGDSMDMASPYPGHADDFEIDIDIMEDQTSNADHDFDLKDASPEAMPQMESLAAGAEPSNDADMMDDVAEPSETNPLNNNAENHNQNGSAFYSGHAEYESEMLDEDYEEDIDAPIPDSEVVIVQAAPTVEPGEDFARTQTLEEQTGPSNDQDPQVVGSVVNEQDQHGDVEEYEPSFPNEGINQHNTEQFPEGLGKEHHQHDEGTSHHNDTNRTAHVESTQPPALTNNEDPIPGQPEEGQPEEVGRVQDSAEEHDQNPQTEHDYQGEDERLATKQHEAYLHPVKVLYQESEISLFPPREGDSSETFFLENEGLAYGTIDHLLAACRGVLGEHVSDDEALVVDIDSLGLQLSEDNLHVSKVTLSQIVDVYLRLCHNDGVDEPEPLYLTLNTRSTLPAQVSNLAIAADDGKGVSLVHSWDEFGNQGGEELGDYPAAADNEDSQGEQAGVSDDLPANAISGASVQSEEAEDDVAPPNPEVEDHAASADQALERHLSGQDETNAEDTNDANDADTNQEVVENAKVSEEQVHGPVSAAEASEGDDHAGDFDDAPHEDAQGEHQSEKTFETTELPVEGSYDSEEHTESTTTLTHGSVTQSDDRQQGQMVDPSPGHDHITFDHEDYEHEQHDAGEDFVDGNEGEAEEDTFEDQNFEEGEEDYDEEEYENENEEDEDAAATAALEEDFTRNKGIPSESADVHASATSPPHEASSGPDNVRSTDYQSLDAIPDPYDHIEGGKELSVDNVSQSGEATRATPEPAGDLLGLDEDIFASPEKEVKTSGPTLARQADEDSDNPEEEQTIPPDYSHSSHQSGDDLEELDFDDEDYIELDDIDHPENENGELEDGELEDDKLHIHGSGPGKRSRESEDEADLAELPTPEAKRSRPS